MKEEIKESKIKKFLSSKHFPLILLLVVMVILFTILSGGAFLKPVNIKNILNSMVLVTLLTIGCGCLIILGHVDLSASYVGTFGGALMTVLLVNVGLHWSISIIIALIACICMGLFNAFCVSKMNFPAFITTLGMAKIAEGIAYVLTDASSINIDNPVILWIGNTKVFKFVPVSIFFAFGLLLIYGIVLAKTVLGRKIYLCGGNPKAASLSGLRPKKITYLLFANASMLSCLAGIIYAGRMKSGTANGIKELQFSGMTAAILGGISFAGGSGGMGSALIGLLILNCFNNGLLLCQVTAYWQKLASGLLLVFALVLDYAQKNAVSKSTSKKLRKEL